MRASRPGETLRASLVVLSRMLPLFEAVRLSWVRGGDDAVLLAGAGMLGGVAVAAASLCAGLSADCSARWLLMGSLSAAARPWKLLCVMEVRGERAAATVRRVQVQVQVQGCKHLPVPVLSPSRGGAFA